MNALNNYVLIADDEPHIAIIIERTVQHMGGFTTVVVSDGAQAVETARALGSRLACVISDVLMPIMTGVDAAVAIQEFAPDVPIILMSASNYEALAQYVIPLPQISFLEKPFRLTALQSLLTHVLYEKEREV